MVNPNEIPSSLSQSLAQFILFGWHGLYGRGLTFIRFWSITAESFGRALSALFGYYVGSWRGCGGVDKMSKRLFVIKKEKV